ncbi:RNA polymerase II transcription factor SIII subunit A-domain-containing protein [Aspergillus undulatus]|uniref:RNA polymerase II transcription factor SIII subunit A-domain-containing protein n=1 Tax=Aspergillus undulatus TaxID=1810928 RepID=UPI003CCE1363
MPVPPLRQLCTATAIRNVKYLNDIGNIPYVLARPFLVKIESPEKLRSLELQSPHLMQHDAELWLEFIKRDIPKWDEYELPEQPDCWYDVYCALREEVQRTLDEDAEKLKMALEGITSERAKHSTVFVPDRRLTRLPRDRPTAKQRYASYDRKMGGITPVFSSKSGGSSDDPRGSAIWNFERPSLPRPKAPKKDNIFTTKKRNNVLAVPTQHLNSRATQVRQAPRSLIEEHRRAPEPAIARNPALRAPGRANLQNTSRTGSPGRPSNPVLEDREARLRAIAQGRSWEPSRSRAPPQVSSPDRPASARPSSGTLPTSSDSQSQANTDPEPPRPTIRKRPAPNPLLPPKKKRVN